MAVNMTAVNVPIGDWESRGDGSVHGSDPEGTGGGGDYAGLTPDYFVKASGSNGSAGTSEGTAFATLAFAYTQMSAGDVLGVVDDITEVLSLATLENNPGTLANHMTTVGKDIYTKVAGAITDGASSLNCYHIFKHIHFDGLSSTAGHKSRFAKFIKFIGCIFECSGNGVSGNNQMHAAGSFHLYESCGFIGNGGRYNSYAFQKTNTVYRWCLFRSEQNVWTNDGNPTGGCQIYSSDDCEVLGCVSIDNLNPDTSAEWLGAFVQTTNQGASTGVKFTGCVAQHDIGYGFHCEGNNASDTAYLKCISTENDHGMGSGKSNIAITSDNCLLGNNVDRGTIVYNSASNTMTNSNSFGNGTSNLSGITDGGGNTEVSYTLSTEIGALKQLGLTGVYYGDTDYNTEQTGDAFPMPLEDEMRTVFATVSNRGFCAVGKTLTSYMKEQP